MNSAVWRTQRTTGSHTPRLLREIGLAASPLTRAEVSLGVISQLEAITVTGYMTRIMRTTGFLDSQATTRRDNPMAMYPGPMTTASRYPSQPPAGTSLSITRDPDAKRFSLAGHSEQEQLYQSASRRQRPYGKTQSDGYAARVVMVRDHTFSPRSNDPGHMPPYLVSLIRVIANPNDF